MDTPLSRSSVSMKLSLIQKRCQELLEQEQLELTLEDQEQDSGQFGDKYNPYNRSR